MTSIISQVQEQQPHQRRVLIEYLDLQEKARALRAYLAGDQIKGLEPLDQNLLFEQYRIMGMYMGILENRMERFVS